MKRMINSSSKSVKASWAGTSNIRREIENMIDNGCTRSDIQDFLDGLEITSNLSSHDYDMLMTFADGELDQKAAWDDMIH